MVAPAMMTSALSGGETRDGSPLPQGKAFELLDLFLDILQLQQAMVNS